MNRPSDPSRWSKLRTRAHPNRSAETDTATGFQVCSPERSHWRERCNRYQQANNQQLRITERRCRCSELHEARPDDRRTRECGESHDRDRRRQRVSVAGLHFFILAGRRAERQRCSTNAAVASFEVLRPRHRERRLHPTRATDTKVPRGFRCDVLLSALTR